MRDIQFENSDKFLAIFDEIIGALKKHGLDYEQTIGVLAFVTFAYGQEFKRTELTTFKDFTQAVEQMNGGELVMTVEKNPRVN